jgi:hypothetical protein
MWSLHWTTFAQRASPRRRLQKTGEQKNKIRKPRPSDSRLWKDKTLTEDSSISKSFFACWRISKENERKIKNKKKQKKKKGSQKNTPSLLMARLENKMDFL